MERDYSILIVATALGACTLLIVQATLKTPRLVNSPIQLAWYYSVTLAIAEFLAIAVWGAVSPMFLLRELGVTLTSSALVYGVAAACIAGLFASGRTFWRIWRKRATRRYMMIKCGGMLLLTVYTVLVVLPVVWFYLVLSAL